MSEDKLCVTINEIEYRIPIYIAKNIPLFGPLTEANNGFNTKIQLDFPVKHDSITHLFGTLSSLCYNKDRILDYYISSVKDLIDLHDTLLFSEYLCLNTKIRISDINCIYLIYKDIEKHSYYKRICISTELYIDFSDDCCNQLCKSDFIPNNIFIDYNNGYITEFIEHIANKTQYQISNMIQMLKITSIISLRRYDIIHFLNLDLSDSIQKLFIKKVSLNIRNIYSILSMLPYKSKNGTIQIEHISPYNLDGIIHYTFRLSKGDEHHNITNFCNDINADNTIQVGTIVSFIFKYFADWKKEMIACK